MRIQKALLVDVERCVGCYTCVVACQQEHHLPEGMRWITLYTAGPIEADGRLVMDFIPRVNVQCDLCAARIIEGTQPACMVACPTHALLLADEKELLRLLRRGARYQICKLA